MDHRTWRPRQKVRRRLGEAISGAEALRTEASSRQERAGRPPRRIARRPCGCRRLDAQLPRWRVISTKFCVTTSDAASRRQHALAWTRAALAHAAPAPSSGAPSRTQTAGRSLSAMGPAWVPQCEGDGHRHTVVVSIGTASRCCKHRLLDPKLSPPIRQLAHPSELLANAPQGRRPVTQLRPPHPQPLCGDGRCRPHCGLPPRTER